jgi:hypothetical protein
MTAETVAIDEKKGLSGDCVPDSPLHSRGRNYFLPSCFLLLCSMILTAMAMIAAVPIEIAAAIA